MFEYQYYKLVNHILTRGEERETRNAPTKAIFGNTMVLNELTLGFFPMLFGRKLFYKGVLGEVAAFFKGPKSLADFENFGCNYWKQWANEDGSINVHYGNKWIDFNGVNQLEQVIASIKNNPTSRRHIISGWDPATVHETSLPCCHLLYQWYVNGDQLDMMIYLRSLDVMIGLPSDVILAAAMNIAMANWTGKKPGRLIINSGDTHIYKSHFEPAKLYCHNVGAINAFQSVGYTVTPNFTEFTPEVIQIPEYDLLNLPVIKFELHS